MTDGGRLVPQSFIDWQSAYLGSGQVVDGRYYDHEFSSVPVGWINWGSGFNADLVTVYKQSASVLFSRELIEDQPNPYSMTWAQRAARDFERNRLRNRIRRIPEWWRAKRMAIRRAVAYRIYPFSED